MSYYTDQAKAYIKMHIEAHGSTTHTVKRWKTEVRCNRTMQAYSDWAAERTIQKLGLVEPFNPAPSASPPSAPAPIPR